MLLLSRKCITGNRRKSASRGEGWGSFINRALRPLLVGNDDVCEGLWTVRVGAIQKHVSKEKASTCFIFQLSIT